MTQKGIAFGNTFWSHQGVMKLLSHADDVQQMYMRRWLLSTDPGIGNGFACGHPEKCAEVSQFRQAVPQALHSNLRARLERMSIPRQCPKPHDNRPSLYKWSPNQHRNE